MGILLHPDWWQNTDATSPPVEWEANTQLAAVTANHPAGTRFAVGTALPDGTPVVLSGTTLPAGFSRNTTYYVVSLPSIDLYTFGLSSTIGGAPIAASDAGTAVRITDMRYYISPATGGPTPAYPDSDVILLLHFDGTDGATTFTDSSLYNETNTNMGYNGEISATHPQFGTGAFSSGAGGGFARVIYNNAIDPLPDRYHIRDGKDFSIQASIYKAAPEASDNGTLFSMNRSSPSVVVFVEVLTNAVTGFVSARVRTVDGLTTIAALTGTTNVCDGAYHQVSFERLGTTYYLYVDGGLQASVTAAGTVGYVGATQVSVGMSEPAEGNTNILRSGYVDEVRFINGYAVNQGASSYTPQIAPFTDPAGDVCDPHFNDVSLLMHFDGNLTDSSSYAHTMTAGNVDALGAPIVGTHSWNNTGSYSSCSLTTPIVPGGPFDFQAADTESFTVEFWYRPSSADVAGGYPPVLLDMTNNGTTGFFVQLTLDPVFQVQVYGAGSAGQPSALSDSLTPVAGTAYHIAVVMDASANTWTLYINGVSENGPSTVTLPWSVAFGGNLRIGGSFGFGPTGHIDELRITKGVARYTADFVPLPVAFPDMACTADAVTLEYVGNINTPSLQSGLFGMLRLRYDVIAISSNTLNFVYNTGAGAVTQALTNELNAHGIISICLDGATQLDFGLGAGANDATVAFSEAPGDSTYGNVNFNCMCPELPVFETLTELRNRMMLRLGFGAQVANPPPGMTALLNEFLISAQKFLWKKYPATFTRRLFTWNMQPLERFYGVLGNDDDPYRNLRMDFTKGIEWSGIYDQKNTWTPITEGIPPELYTMVTQAGRPQRYELRECIEVFPAPDVPYTLVLKGHIDLQPFASDNDTTTIDSEVVFLFALATAKAHYGQVDAPATGKMAMDYLGELTAGTHLNKRYIPGPRPLSPVVKPQMVQFQDGN